MRFGSVELWFWLALGLGVEFVHRVCLDWRLCCLHYALDLTFGRVLDALVQAERSLKVFFVRILV